MEVRNQISYSSTASKSCTYFLNSSNQLARFVIRVRCHHLRVNRFAPRRQLLPQLRCDFGTRARQIVAFAEVVFQIVQLNVIALIKLDQLVIALPNHCVGLIEMAVNSLRCKAACAGLNAVARRGRSR